MNIEHWSQYDLQQLEQLELLSNRANTFFVDLADEVPYPFKAALDIAAQISNIAYSSIKNCINTPVVAKIYAVETDKWVDIESLGNPVVLKAKLLVEILLQQLSLLRREGQWQILVQVGALGLSQAERLVLQYFVDGLQAAKLVFISAHVIQPVHHGHVLDLEVSVEASHQLLDCVLLAKSQLSAAILPSCLQLNNEMVLIINDQNSIKSYRSRLTELVTNLADTLADPYTLDYIEAPSLDYVKLAHQVIAYAWVMANLGANDVACQLLATGLQATTSKPVVQLHYLVSLQFLRLVSGYFNQAAQQEYPSYELPTELADKLYYAKAYCAVMANQLDIAQQYFQLLDIEEKAKKSLTTNALYRLNIYALYNFRRGDVLTAERLEQKIRQHIDQLTVKPVQIMYINALNLARLYRSQGKLNQAEHYFRRGYQSIAGYKTASDYVYANINWASLAEARQDARLALVYWVKAGLHWLAMQHPAALAWRCAKALLKRHIIQASLNNPQDMAQALLQKCEQLMQACGIACPQYDFTSVHLSHLESIDQRALSSYYYGSGLAFAAMTTEYNNHTANDEFCVLKNQLLSLAVSLMNIQLPKDIRTLVIDVDNHDAMPSNAAAAFKRAVLLGVERFHLATQITPIHQSERHEYYRNILVSLNQTTVDIDWQTKEPSVTFRRYYATRQLSPLEARVLHCLRQRGDVSLADILSSCQASVAELLQLAAQNLIQFVAEASRESQHEWDRIGVSV